MIFYADDDLDDIDIFEEITRRHLGTDTITFTTGDSLIRKLATPPPIPSIVFLDVNMPLKNGLEVLAEIRADRKWDAVPVVMLTTSASEDIMDSAFDAGANFYITKSSSYPDLVESLRHALSIDWASFDATRNNFVYQP